MTTTKYIPGKFVHLPLTNGNQVALTELKVMHYHRAISVNDISVGEYIDILSVSNKCLTNFKYILSQLEIMSNMINPQIFKPHKLCMHRIHTKAVPDTDTISVSELILTISVSVCSL